MNFLKYTLDRYTYKLSAQTRLFVKGAIFRTAPPLGKNPDKKKEISPLLFRLRDGDSNAAILQ